MSAVAPVSWWLLQLPKENGTVGNDTIRFQIGSDSLDQDVILRPMDDRGHQLVRIRNRAVMIHAEGLRRKIRKGLDALSMGSEACFLLADKEHLSCAFTFFEEPMICRFLPRRAWPRFSDAGCRSRLRLRTPLCFHKHHLTRTNPYQRDRAAI